SLPASRTHLHQALYIDGHLSSGLLPCLSKHHVTVTTLRDPVERALSWLFHTRRKLLQDPTAFAGVDFSQAGVVEPLLRGDLSALLRCPVFRARLSDMQCRWLGLDIDVGSMLGGERDSLRLAIHAALVDLDPDVALARATCFLGEMALVGLVEQPEATARMAGALVGLPFLKLPTENQNPDLHARGPLLYRERVDSQVIAWLDNIIRCD
ncbi:unnamed protein product, partial [Phaeothamnion confervicola]